MRQDALRIPLAFSWYNCSGVRAGDGDIFDPLHDRSEFIKQINLSSSFQWYGLTSLWSDVQKFVANDIYWELIH